MYRVYEYGQSGFEKIDETAALDQISKRHRFWNQLVEIERAYRAQVRATLRDESQDRIDALKEEVARITSEIKAKRKAARKRSIDLGGLPAELAQLRRQFAELTVAAKAARPGRIAENKQALKALDSQRYAAVKQATHESGLHWLNSDDATTCYDAARKRAMRSGVDLRFQRWQGGAGKIAIRYQKGLPVAKVFASDTRFQIDPVQPEAYASSTPRYLRRRLARTRCRIRVASDKNRAPVWLEIPIAFYRPLPEQGVIRTVFAVREVIAQQARWKVCVCVDEGDCAPALRRGPAVAIDLGWRLLPGGLRVAYYADAAGEHGDLVLPDRITFAFRKLDDLRQIQDNHLDALKAAIARWLATEDQAPVWMTEAKPKPGTVEPVKPSWGDISTIGQWRSSGRMERLARAMPADAPAELQRLFGDWLKRHLHLHRWEKHLRDQAIRDRREIYRVWSRRLIENHGLIILEQFDLRQVAKSGDVSADRTKPQGGWQRTVAAVSILRQTLKALGQHLEVDAAYTTQYCSWCGSREKWDASESIMHRCSGCGALFDQDHNAARNMLRLSEIAGDEPQKPDLPDSSRPAAEKLVVLSDISEAAAAPSSGA